MNTVAASGEEETIRADELSRVVNHNTNATNVTTPAVTMPRMIRNSVALSTPGFRAALRTP